MRYTVALLAVLAAGFPASAQSVVSTHSGLVYFFESPAGTSVKLLYKNWQARVPEQGVYRIDADPAQVRVYKGAVEVAADGQNKAVMVRDGEVLPLAAVLVAERSPAVDGDSFKSWAMSRSDAIAADNAIAAEIVDRDRIPSRVAGARAVHTVTASSTGIGSARTRSSCRSPRR